ncbi:YnfA family protein [Moraxella sp. FZFQ2102]|uniref:YnfA family protein n=1 Tax=Moraxella sp. FZFQ2102 TaxID=2953752 RepID=UPI00209C066E|nr:YnfA family protein [Moraxella sp. FZFQ2102]USZ14754.1 YnfA family protein [Moraxella sp. FZFQ2102]
MSDHFTSFSLMRTLLLFFVTAVAEILGCYFPYLMFNQGKSAWLWLPTIISLLAFVYLLSLHPDASGRIYAMYGGIYICTALIWLKVVDGVSLSTWDITGAAVVLVGTLIIILQPRQGI